MNSGGTGGGASTSAPSNRPPYLNWIRIIDSPTPGSVLPSPRQGHRAVIFGGNQMLVFGGETEDAGISSELHVLDASKNKWFQPNVKGEIPPGLAGFGMALDGDRLLIHGGKLGDSRYSSDLYQLSIPTWEWRKLHPLGPEDAEPPCARMGHSFSILSDEIYLFGGMTKGLDRGWEHSSRVLNDLHVLKIRLNDGNGAWTTPRTLGTPPCPRHHHTAVAYSSTSSGKSHLIVFGGSGTESRLGDLQILNLNKNKKIWWTTQLMGVPPSPCSFHSATLIGNKMYVFGGFEGLNELGHEWNCSNSVACLSIQELKWEELHQYSLPVQLVAPLPRASHSAVELNNGIVVWSGRDGIKLRLGGPVCFHDMWRLEIQRSGGLPRILTLRPDVTLKNAAWDPATRTTSYFHGLTRIGNAPQRYLMEGTPRQMQSQLPLTPFPNPIRQFYPIVRSGMQMLGPASAVTSSVQLRSPQPSSTSPKTYSSSQAVPDAQHRAPLAGAMSAPGGNPTMESSAGGGEEDDQVRTSKASEGSLPGSGDDDME